MRSPNLPLRAMITLSPEQKQLANADSIAPVPEHASSSTSFVVSKMYFSPSTASMSVAENSGVRWWIIGLACASRTSAGTGVGPGVIRYFFCIGSSPSQVVAYRHHGGLLVLVLLDPAEHLAQLATDLLDRMGGVDAAHRLE